MKKFAFIFLMLLIAGPALAQPAEPFCMNIGHRGARALSDENTLESLKLAAELGVNMIEFDIQRTSDGVFVLMHDETVDRTTDGTGRVDGMTLADFRKLKTERGYTPPTLEEVLDWLQTNDLMFILDFKITNPDHARELIDMVEKHGLLVRAIFESPDPAVAGMVEEIRPDVVTAIYPTNMLAMRYYINKYNIDYASYYYPFANPLELVMRPKDRKVMVWTVNNKQLINMFRRLKVDGIMTDDPNLFKDEPTPAVEPKP